MGGKGESQVKEHVQKTHGNEQWGGNCLWEQGLDRVGRATVGTEMGTTVTEQQFLKKTRFPVDL